MQCHIDEEQEISKMKRSIWITGGLLIATVPLVAATAPQPDPIPLTAASVIVEINATDGDAGLQPFLDGEAWKRVTVYRPDGRKLFDVRTRGNLTQYGLTELFSESSEPPFTEFPLEEFKKLFPEGEYRFEATSISGERMVGSDTLTHDFPAGPVIVSPRSGATVDSDRLVVRWKPVTKPDGIDMVGYQVLVEREDPLRVFSADLPATATRVRIPRQFLEPGTEYKVEVLAIEVSGNQTLTEVDFTAG
ncbi:MAG TPA: fibronectin type III domain-containing protein, partial [Acidimicrobiia bacterium]|nr:fibronectin type III domain-containing protein [Acidimicrobiia bacterium]